MEWFFEAHQKATIADILATDLPPEDKQKFKTWSQEVCTADFNKLLGDWFGDDEITDKIASYVIERLEELEHFTGSHVSALVKINGKQHDYKCFNEALQI